MDGMGEDNEREFMVPQESVWGQLMATRGERRGLCVVNRACLHRPSLITDRTSPPSSFDR